MPSRTAILRHVGKTIDTSFLSSVMQLTVGGGVYVVDESLVSVTVTAAFAVAVLNSHRHVRRPQFLLEVLLP